MSKRGSTGNGWSHRDGGRSGKCSRCPGCSCDGWSIAGPGC